MNGKSTKERKRKQEVKETSMDQNTRDRKGKPIMFIMGDSMVKKLKDYLPTKKKLNIEALLKYDHSPLQKSITCRTTLTLLFET